jgi:8-oxo-dGTP pyrophosphatase MutT (NUDIX family)
VPISDYMRSLRERVGTSLVVVPSATALVFDDEDRILLVRHSNGGVWVAPGGAIDPDESPQDAVVREVWEETGLNVEPTALCGVFGGPEFRVTYENGDVTSYVTSVFECRRLGGELRADGDEVLECRYFSAAELGTITLAPWSQLLVPRLMRGPHRAWIPPVIWKPPV